MAKSTPSTSGSGTVASPTTITPISSPQIPTTIKTIGDSGIETGRTRYFDEDVANRISREAVENELARISRLSTQIEEQRPVESAVSPQQNIFQMTSRKNLSPTRQQDITRALQKLQRTCNHTFDKSSGRCLYCSKHRDSHVYDVGSKSILG